MKQKECDVMVAGKRRRFEDVEFIALKSRKGFWFLPQEERYRLDLLTMESLLTQVEPWSLVELRYFVGFLRLNPEEIGERLGFTPEEWNRYRNDDPRPEFCERLKPFFRESFEKLKSK